MCLGFVNSIELWYISPEESGRIEPTAGVLTSVQLIFASSEVNTSVMTITRLWHGRTKLEDADTYLAYIIQTGIAEYTCTPGNLSAKVLRRTEGEFCHFITISEWDSYESIKNFVGEDFENAKYYDEDKKFLVEFEQKVIHYETYS